MKLEILNRAFHSIAWAGIVTFFALTLLMVNDINPDVSTIWLYMLASIVLSIYFGLASYIFEVDTWSPLKKTIIHFILSIAVYYVIALPIGWVPVTARAIIISTIIFIFIYIVFWLGFTLYYKKIESSLNKSLNKK